MYMDAVVAAAMTTIRRTLLLFMADMLLLHQAEGVVLSQCAERIFFIISSVRYSNVLMVLQK